MTDRQKSKDLKNFQELLKVEVAKLGAYDREVNTLLSWKMQEKLQEIDNMIHKVNFQGAYFNDFLVSLSIELAALAFTLATNAQAEYERDKAERDY